MTIDEFCEELKSVADQFKWYMIFSGGIRGLPKKWPLGESGCPLTCVDYIKNKNSLSTYKYLKAANRLGVLESDAEIIANAADDRFTLNTITREKLKKAVGIDAAS